MAPRPKANNAQRQSVVTALRGICRDYPAGGGILRELLQNADDAGASTMKFVLDKNTYSKDNLLDPGLAEYQGPALLAYNDALFSDKDFESLSRIGDSCKREERSTTGKFGKGFNSVYNWTDCPSILSRDSLLILDPHHGWSAKTEFPGGPVWNFVENAEDEAMMNQLASFGTIIHELDKPFQGTIIRIPLRTASQAKTSGICDRQTTVAGLEDVMKRFEAEFGPSGLLFMRSVETISMSVGEVETSSISIVNSDEVRSKKLLINSEINESPLEGSNHFQLSFEVDIEHGTPKAKSRTRFAVHHSINNEQANEELKAWSKAEKLVPWVAVAAPVPTMAGLAMKGSLFTVLPLHIANSQPVHIHALFSLSSDRSRLHNNSDSSIQDRFPGQWNEWLFSCPIPFAWTQMLLYLAKQYPSLPSFEVWPRGLDDTNMSHVLLKNVLELIKDGCHQVWYTNLGYKSWNAALLARGDEPECLKEALQNVGVPIIYLTCDLRSSIAKHCKLKCLGSERLCKRLKEKTENLRALDKKDKRHLLDYLLSDPSFRDYGAVELFPFEDGSYRAITADSAFVHRNKIEHELFGGQPHLNIDLDQVSSDSRERLRRDCRECWNSSLRYREIHDLKSYCLSSFFRDCDPNADLVTLGDNANDFISMVWNWILSRDYRINDEAIDSLWLLPLANGQYRKVRPRNLSCEAIYAPSGELGNCIRKLGIDSAPCGNHVLRADHLPYEMLQDLLKASKTDSQLCLMHGNVLEDFVLWFSKNPRAIDAAPDKDKVQFQELVASRLDQRKNGDAIPAAIKGLTIFPKADWVLNRDSWEPSPRWVNLGSGMQVVGLQKNFPVPELPNILFIDAESQSVARLLRKLKLANCLPAPEVLQEFIIPGWESQASDSWTFDYKKKTADMILSQYQSLTQSYQERVASLPLVPRARIDGPAVHSFATAKQLIDPDPSISSLRDLFFEDEEACPQEWVMSRYRGVLIQCGLQIKLSENLAEDRVRCYGKGLYPFKDVEARATSLLKSRPKWKSSSDAYTNTEIRELQWLPTIDKDGKKSLRSAGQCRSINDRLLVNHVLPLVGLELSRSSGWLPRLGWDDVIPVHILIDQLKQATTQLDRHAVDAVLMYLKEKQLTEATRPLLVNLPFVLTSEGHYEYPRKTFCNHCEGLQPYFHNIDKKFWQDHNQLLEELGITDTPSVEDLLKIQDELHTPLNETDIKLMLKVIERLAEFPRDKISSLKIVDTEANLCSIGDITFNDEGFLTLKQHVNLTHPSISSAIVKKLGIEPVSERLRKKELAVEDADDDDEFYQREEVATNIADTLERYPIEATFKEYLANADDAGTASQINFLLDERSHPKETLLTAELAELQGPALLIHNNGTFQEKDFEGLKHVGRGSKRDDSSVIGKFGRGSQTMYHWSDVPMLLSGGYLLILDPLQQVLPMNYRKGQRKPGVKIELSKIRKSCPDQLKPFEGLWGYDIEQDKYNGTIFRFPLRPQGAQSRLRESTTSLDAGATCRCLEAFFPEARISMLFLRKVRQMDFQVYGESNFRWSVECQREEPEGYFSGWSVCKLSRGTDSAPQTTAQDRWWVAIQDPPELPVHLQNRHKRTMKDVECGMAALVSSTSSDKAIITEKIPEPRVFSTLPLSFESKLPVHIHATFIITGDRQSIPIEKSMEDAGSEWNKWLLQNAIPNLYLGFLEDLGRKVGQDVYSFWPQKPPPSGTLSELIHAGFWNMLPQSSHRLFPIMEQISSSKKRNIPKLDDIKNVTFDFLPKFQSEAIRELLQKFIKSLVRPPTLIAKQIRSIEPAVTSVTRDTLINLIRSDAGSQALQEIMSKDANSFETILKIIVSSGKEELNKLDGCQILPLANRRLGTLKLVNDHADVQYYYLAAPSEVELFDFASDLLLSFKQGSQLIDAVIANGKFNIQTLELSHVGVLLDKKDFKKSALNSGNGKNTWLRRFWDFCHKREEIWGEVFIPESIQCHPIHEATVAGKTVSLSARRFDELPLVIQPDLEEHKQLCHKLSGLYVLNNELITSKLRWEEKNFEHENAFRRFMEALSQLAKIQNLGLEAYVRQYLEPEHLKTLRALVRYHDSHYNTNKWRDIRDQVRHLPLWPAVATKAPLITANNAIIATKDQLFVEWNSLGKRLVRQDIGVLKALGVKSMAYSEIVGVHVLPNLPHDVVQTKGRYLSLIHALSGMPWGNQAEQEAYRKSLESFKFASDGNGLLRRPCKLFDHDDPVFRSALKNEADTKFLLEEVRKHEWFWRSVGLRSREFGRLHAKDYLYCLETLARRLADAPSITETPGLLADTEDVLLPLTTETSALSAFQYHEWQRLSLWKVLPAKTDFGEEPRHRREAMATLGSAKPLLSIGETISYKYVTVCWSQASFPLFSPDKEILARYPSKGKPSATVVWKHLKHLKESVEKLSQAQIAPFLSDLYSTYNFLQQHLQESISSFTLRKTPVWLNLDTVEPQAVLLDDLKSSWITTEHLVLMSSCDAPPVMCVRKGLMPYEALLRGLGCEEIIYPQITRPTDTQTRSLSGSLVRLRNEGKLLDVTFSAEGRDLQAHKVVLAASSEYCERFFNGPWASDKKIVLEDMSYKTLSAMVDFAYNIAIDWTDMQLSGDEDTVALADKLDALLDLLTGADRWLMPALHSQAEGKILIAGRKFVRVENVGDIESCASNAKAHNLEKYCKDFYQQNKKTVDLATRPRN